ncbi:uncharacterized protein LOC119306816 [Triticum dicoccoides]|uniref:uncharacterized protein LOC119306816 n=1 Tax=Triticum dicoccoides TaxID=85692 RepID=UPI00188F3741|nr:uncharacterized protein LOC119306816 [Triticum dicoccoides]
MGAVFSQSQGNGVDIEGGPTNVGHMRLSLLPFAPPPDVAQLAYALLVLGYLTFLLALTTVLHLPAAGPVFGRCAAAYYAILMIILAVFVPLELGTALALCMMRQSSQGRLPAFAKGLLLCAHVLFLVVIAIMGTLFFKFSLVEFLLQGNEASG